MTPKEKAIELTQEFVFRINEYIEPNTWDEVDRLNKLTYDTAKDCAELAVEEIINLLGPSKFLSPELTLGYWLKVKQEIEAL
jgi:hypothetical protein